MSANFPNLWSETTSLRNVLYPGGWINLPTCYHVNPSTSIFTGTIRIPVGSGLILNNMNVFVTHSISLIAVNLTYRNEINNVPPQTTMVQNTLFGAVSYSVILKQTSGSTSKLQLQERWPTFWFYASWKRPQLLGANGKSRDGRCLVNHYCQRSLVTHCPVN